MLSDPKTLDKLRAMPAEAVDEQIISVKTNSVTPSQGTVRVKTSTASTSAGTSSSSSFFVASNNNYNDWEIKIKEELDSPDEFDWEQLV